MNTPASQRCRELDAVRGIAAVMVLLFHYTVRHAALFGDDAAPFHVNHGFFGVEIFFGVSGFVILMTLERCRTPGDFVFARCLRLYPAYWVAVATTFAILSVFPLAERTVTWPQALVNLTMLQEFLGVPHVDGVYWSLEVELVFYVWMLAVFVVDGMRHMHRLIIGWLLLSLAALAATALAGRELPALPNRLLLIEHSPFFAIGAAAFVDFRAARVSRPTWLVFGLAPVAAWLAKGVEGIVVSLAMEVLFALLVWRRAKFLDVRWLVFLGTVSYPLYLLHQNIGYVIINGLRARHVDYGWAMLAATAASLAGACVLTFWIERPIQRRCRAWREQRVARRRAVAAGTPRPADGA